MQSECRVNEATLQSSARRANPLPLNKKDASTHRLACAFPGPPVFLGHHFPLANHAVLSSHLNKYAEGWTRWHLISSTALCLQKNTGVKTGECFSQQCLPPHLTEGDIPRLNGEMFLNVQIGVNTGIIIVSLPTLPTFLWMLNIPSPWQTETFIY